MNTYEIIAYPLIPVSIIELLLGFLLLRQPTRNSSVNRSVAAISFFSSAFCLNTAVMYLRVSNGYDHLFFARMNWIGWFIIPAALQFTFYLRDSASRTARMIGYTLYPYWTVMLALSVFSELIVSREYVLLPFSNRPAPLETFGRLSGSAMIVWLVIEIFCCKRRLSGIKKLQMNYFFTGALVYASAGMVIAGIMPLLRNVRIEPGLVSYFSLPWVVLTFYAMVRYSLFEARIIVSHTLNIVLLVLLLSIVQIVMTRTFQDVLGMELSILISLSIIGFLLFGTPLSIRIRSFIETVVLGDRYRYQNVLRESLHALVSRESMQEVLDLFLRTIRSAFGIADAGLYLQRTDEGYIMRHGSGSFDAMTNRRSLAAIAVEKLRETNKPLVRRELEMLKDDDSLLDLMTYLRGIKTEILIPLSYQGRLRGALALGERENGKTYGQSDIELLETVARQAVVAMENARLLDLARTVRSSLQESEERFQAIARILPTAIFIHQGDEIKFANASGEALTGYSFSELRNLDFWDLIHPNYRSLVREMPIHDQYARPPHSEMKIIKKSGEERWVVMTASMIEYGERTAGIWAFFDITEMKEEEGRRRYQQKMDTARRLAGSLAADFNSILQEILGAGTTIRGWLEREGPLQELAEKILAAAERALWITRNLAEFGHRKTGTQLLVDLNEIVEHAEKVISGLLTQNVKLTVNRSQECLPVMADPAKIEGVLMSLAINGRDAMPQGGALTVEAGEIVIDATFIRTHGYGTAGTYAYFTVTDTGIGMDETMRKQVFEPFFTTKTELRAIGFSMAIVYDTVKEHGGYITLESTPGVGSVFTVFLPRAARPDGQGEPPPGER